jgi:hypothetical protein
LAAEARIVRDRVHRRQQRLAQFVPLEQVSKLAASRLIRRSLLAQIDAGEAAHRHRVVQRFLQRRIRQVEPQLQKVQARHPLQRNRRAAAQLAHLRIVRLDHRYQICLWHDLIHVREKLRPPRRLAVALETRQRLLLHRRIVPDPRCSILHQSDQ